MKMFSKKVFALFLAFVMMILAVPFHHVSAEDNQLSLDDVKIKSFKIIDVADSDKEIEYKLSGDSDYTAYSKDPAKFSNALNEGQKNSKIKLNLAIEYKGNTALKEGDTLTIPATHGGSKFDFSQQVLKDKDNKVLGSWEYKKGNFVIKFSGDYIRDNQVKKFTASFETGEMINYRVDAGFTTTLGERRALFGKLGKQDLCIAAEKEYIWAKNFGTTGQAMQKTGSVASDTNIFWSLSILNDFVRKDDRGYFCVYLLENNGQYNPNSYTSIYMEDTFKDVVSAPTITRIATFVSGVNDSGEVLSGWYNIELPLSMFHKIEQGSQDRETVKDSLKAGEYCIFDNHDGTYTFMMKWWDMNDSSGLTYNDIPEIQSAGGVGNYLEKQFPDIYGKLAKSTIQRINDAYDGKAIQDAHLMFSAQYKFVNQVSEKENTATVTTDQTGEKEVTATGKMTPAAGIADAPADPLTLKMIKSDKDTGTALSTDFTFELQTSTDDGATWNAVTVDSSMVDKGTLNANNTLTPDEQGVIQVKKLTGNNLYRFVEKSHAQGYQDTTVDNSKPNDKTNTASANSTTVKVTNQGKGQVINMYNEKAKASYKEEYYLEDANGSKNWNGKKYSVVSADTKTYTAVVDTAVQAVHKNYTGYKVSDVTYQDSVTAEAKKALKVKQDSSLVVRHYYTKLTPTKPKKEVYAGNTTTNIDGKVVQPGQELTYAITYKNTTGATKNVTITDKLPAHTSFVSADKGGTLSGDTVTWTNTVADGKSLTVKVTVKVNDDVNGQVLENTAKVNDGQNDFDTNTTKNMTPVTASLSAMKQLTGRTLQADEFEFVLKDKDGKTVETVKNAADGSITFTSLKFEKVGTYTYTINEKAGSQAGITYDSTTVAATVEVTDDGSGQLKATVSYANNDQTFENTYAAKKTSAELKVTKKLAGKKLEKDQFEFDLVDAATDQVLQTVKNTTDGQVKFAALEYDKVGTYTYKIREHNAGQTLNGIIHDNLEVTATVTVTDDGQGNLHASVTYSQDTEFNNTYTPAKTQVKVTKNWDDANNQDGKRVASVTVKLLADGVDTGKTAELNEANNWTATFDNLDADKGGTPITYKVVEETVIQGYTPEITGDANTGFTITNKYVPETVDLTVHKNWDDANNQDGIRPKEITVHLLADGQKVDSKKIEANAAGKWSTTFTNKPKYKNGKEIKYTVVEETVSEYKGTTDGLNITNSYTPKVVDYEVTKKWDDNDNQDGKRPKEITVHLMKTVDGVKTKVATKVVTEADSWKYTFTNLPKYEAGKEITYSVEEDKVEGYDT
ncbi:Cna B-type domain-containing protein, partial [Streptococcus massiliensis]